MRSLLVIVALVACTCVVFGDDKSKAKSKAAAALNLAKARAEAERKPAVKADAVPLTDLAKAKEVAAETGKPLVAWVGPPAPAATVKAVDAVHVVVPTFPEVPKARTVVFRCREGVCDVKSSVEQTPSVELLRSMIKDAGSSADAGEAREFFIGTNMEEALPDVPAKAATVTRYEVRYEQVCEGGVCRMVRRLVPVVVPVETSAPAPLPDTVWTTSPAKAAADCPCVAATGSCPCSAQAATASRSRPVFFPAVRSAIESFQARPRLFDGQFVNAIAARFRR